MDDSQDRTNSSQVSTVPPVNISILPTSTEFVSESLFGTINK